MALLGHQVGAADVADTGTEIADPRLPSPDPGALVDRMTELAMVVKINDADYDFNCSRPQDSSQKLVHCLLRLPLVFW